MPEQLFFHCAVTLNDSTVAIIGGKDSQLRVSNKTLFYNFNDGKWTYGPELIHARYSHSCAGFIKENELRIYVIGGFDDTPSVPCVLDSVELGVLDRNDISLMNWHWIEGPTFPIKIDSHSLVATNNALYVIGGFEFNQILENCAGDLSTLDSIFELNLFMENTSWIQLPQRMSMPKRLVSSLFIPDELVTCN